MLPERSPNVVFQPVADGAVLLHSGTEVYFGLNAVGARIWNLLPPECGTLDQLCERLAADFPGAAIEMIRQDVTELLDDLKRYELLGERQTDETVQVDREGAAVR